MVGIAGLGFGFLLLFPVPDAGGTCVGDVTEAGIGVGVVPTVVVESIAGVAVEVTTPGLGPGGNLLLSPINISEHPLKIS